jgi:hypothetical protein
VAVISEVSDEEIPDVGFVIDDQNLEESGSRLWHVAIARHRERG